jgi:tetratricopeptide (TPR) repeat protein
MLHNRPVAALLLLICGIAWMPAADEAPKGQPKASDTGVLAPPVPTPSTATSASALLKSLPPVSSLIERDGKAWWVGTEPTFAYQITAVDEDNNAIITTEVGELKVMRRLMADNRQDAVDALAALLAHAKGAQVDTAGMILREGLLTGLHLFSAQMVVLNEGVLKRKELPEQTREADRAAVSSAVDKVIAAFAQTTLDEVGKKSLDDVLRRAAREDGNEKVDEVSPGFARRLVRGGWLRTILPDQAAVVSELEKAIITAEKFVPVMAFEGTGLQLAEVSDGFGNRNRWILTTPTRSSYVQDQELPLYYWALPDPTPRIAIDLPAGADPTALNTTIERVRLFNGETKLLEWTNKTGMVVDQLAWRMAYPTRGKGIDENAVTNVMPPHVLVTGLNGDIVGLRVPGGMLLPPKDGSAKEVERFLADSARLLPDPAHLDLIGQYILSYVYDSPDSRFPFLVGNRVVKGDIHQTAAQTIGTVTCGMIRGDCDDLSELYQTIAERQGRGAHVISLPQHAAAAFAEKKEDGLWYAYTLQTGPAMEFKDEKLQNALQKLYTSFDDGESFDPNGLGILLRFSGENTRGPWRLSYRIFSEPEYAKIMIDVQRDWQYQTYQRGIVKMKKLIADGDHDNANYRELSGLYSFTGEYDKAVEYHQEAISRTDDLEGKLSLYVELVQHLFDAKQDDKARELAKDILEKQIPALKKDPAIKERIKATLPQIGMQLCAALAHGKAYDLALRTLKVTQLDDVAAKVTKVGEWLASPQFNQRAWDGSPQLLGLRHQLLQYVSIASEVLDGINSDELTTNADLQLAARTVQDWLNLIAFHDVDEPEDALNRYATAGGFYSAMLGEERFDALLASVELPKKNDRNHAKRIGGLAQLQLDLPWIKLSVPYWTTRMMKLFEKERTTLDKSEVAKFAKNIRVAYDACVKMGLDSPLFDRNLHLSLVIAAMVSQDDALLRERLKWVVEKDDKRLRDDTAQWLGDAARFVPLDAYKNVIKAWKDGPNYKPKWFWIAWRAALNGAPQHALMVAEMAKNEFKDDLSFAEEYEYMKTLFDAPVAAPSVVPVAPDKTPAQEKAAVGK